MTDENKITFTYSMVHEMDVFEQNMLYQKELIRVEHELSLLNLNRGGGKLDNLSGFVFENLHTSSENRSYIKKNSKEILQIIDDNGISDMRHLSANGNVTYQQAKMGYSGSNKYKIKKEKYADQVLVVDKGNSELIEYGNKIGLPVKESEISKKMSDTLTGFMKNEGELRQKWGLSNTAPVTSQLYTVSEQLKNANVRGVEAAKGAAALSAGISFGKNMYSFIEGNIHLRELLLNTTKETVLSVGSAYAVGGAGYLASGLLANSPVGVLASQAIGLIVSTEIGATLVSLGPILVKMSAAVGPIFLIGMAIGTGSAVIKSIKVHSEKYKHQMAQINSVINQVLSDMKSAYEDLDSTIKDTYKLWDQSFNNGFEKMLSATLNNNFTEFSLGLDEVLNVFNSHILFKNMDEFDDFFFDENAVLIL